MFRYIRKPLHPNCTQIRTLSAGLNLGAMGAGEHLRALWNKNTLPIKKLTAIALPSLPPGEYWDAIVPGLILRVGARRRTWQYRIRVGGRYDRRPLGHFPGVGLTEARDAARNLVERLDSGTPPAPPPQHPRSAATLTLGGLIDRYEKMRERERTRIKTLPAAMTVLRRCLKPWLDLPAAQFTKADLRAARDIVADRDAIVQANRLLGYVGPVLRWAAEEDLIPFNFTPAIRRSSEEQRKRKLSHEEIAAIWRACGEFERSSAARSFGRLVRFLLTTAQRRDEGASLRYRDIVKGVWRQEQNKSDRPHELRLPKLALSLIGEGDEPDDLVFAGRGGGKISGWSKLKSALDEASGVTGWRLHDLRRTAASGAQEAGASNHVVELVLNHAVPGVAAVYLRAQLEKEKGEALEAWALELARIVRVAP
jgi:integrase